MLFDRLTIQPNIILFHFGSPGNVFDHGKSRGYYTSRYREQKDIKTHFAEAEVRMSRKQPLFIIPVIILLCSLNGCGSSNDSTATRTAATPQPTATPQPEASPATGMKTAPSGLQYEDLTVGVGPKPFLGQTLLVAYAGYNTKGIKFDSGTIDYKPGKDKMIKGFEMGIIGAKGIEPMREGGKRKLIIPPELGYGERIMGTIPPNSTLIFEIELLKVRSSGMGF